MSRILVLIKGLGRGGAERLVVDSLRHFDRGRFAFEVAFVLPWKDALADEVRHLGVPVHVLGNAPGGWVGGLRRLTRRRGYAVIHSHSPYPGSVARAVAPRTTKHVYTEHNVWERYRLPTRMTNALTFGLNDRVLAVSDEVASSIRYPHVLRRRTRIERVYHGVDGSSLRAITQGGARAELGISEDSPLVTVVANLKPHKGHATLLRSVPIVLRDRPDARFLLVGQGPLEADLRRQVRERGLGRAVTIAGYREDVPRLVRASDVFALASYQEGLPISLLEAMALGVPPVITSVGGCPEVVTHDVEGLLVPPRDPVALASAILSLLDDPARRARLAAAALERSADFDLASASRRIEEIYGEVVA